MSDARSVVEAALARAAALVRGDAETLDLLLHDDFGWTTHRGDVLDKAAYVRRNTDGTTRWLAQELTEPQVTVVGDVAVLRTLVTDRVEGLHGPETFRMPMTQTWVRTPAGWRCLAGHAGPRSTDDV